MTHFSWLDYTLFGVYLTASVGVGIYSARGSKSLGDYFLAGRGMNSILVAMSILAALFSGVLNAMNRFAAAAATPILLNLCLMAAMATLPPLFPSVGHALAWGVVAAGIVAAIRA